MVADVFFRRYVLIFMLNVRLMGFEQVKDQYVNDFYFVNVVVECVKGVCDGFFMYEGYLFKMGRMCIFSGSLRELFVREVYSGGFSGYFGEKKIYELLKEYFFWFSMLRDVYKVIERCVICKRVKGKENAYGLYMLLFISE